LDNRIVGLNSQTWGQNINTTGLSIASPGLSTFNQYDVANSIAESGIGYGSNRVTWFGITAVRLYDDHAHKLFEDTTLRPVYPAP
jgi:hypothetical protein